MSVQVFTGSERDNELMHATFLYHEADTFLTQTIQFDSHSFVDSAFVSGRQPPIDFSLNAARARIISLPNLSIIVHTHARTALLWFTTAPLPTRPAVITHYPDPDDWQQQHVLDAKVFRLGAAGTCSFISHTHLILARIRTCQRWRPWALLVLLTLHSAVGGSDTLFYTWKPW